MFGNKIFYSFLIFGEGLRGYNIYQQLSINAICFVVLNQPNKANLFLNIVFRLILIGKF